MNRHGLAPLLIVTLALPTLTALAQGRDLSFEERVGYQRAIEKVYWDHRIWPSVNPGPKPALEAVLTNEQIRARVSDYLKKSNALAGIWNRPITARHLQAEMDRMIADSADPRVLRQIFDALGNDPYVIAETLARPRLADRLMRRFFAERPPLRAWPPSGETIEPETGFEAWWSDAGPSISEVLVTDEGDYTLSPLSIDTVCNPDKWRKTPGPDAGAPAARDDHTAVWTGSEMIVWGGYAGSGIYLDSGGRYDPATDSWSATTTVGAPSARTGHVAVWTGSEMIVWGGWGGCLGCQLDTGGRYDPTTDSWSGTTTVGAPSTREGATAVWSGSGMVVWGGYRYDDINYDQYLDTGGRYDAATDSWSPTTTTGAPSARDLHVASWSGREMIVWGGAHAPTITGGLYDPLADTWSATALTGAPTERYVATAVWTGSEMIVWGGSGNTGYDNVGGCYDPSADNWRATSASDAPDGRWFHTAVWTGSEMIVWGGIGTVMFDTGARYDPVTDTWTPTSTGTGVPGPRWRHTAVWTGSEMIVWGGSQWTQLATGGRYCVQSCTTPALWYRDADADGFVNLTDSVYACTQPTGYGTDPGGGADCDETDPDIHPGAPEINDGKDNQCPGDEGYGVADEIAGSVVFDNPSNRDEICWPAQSGATSYEITRSASSSFTSGCTAFTTGSSCHVDTGMPAEDGCYFYLVRSLSPFTGSWGVDGEGIERVPVCAGSGALRLPNP